MSKEKGILFKKYITPTIENQQNYIGIEVENPIIRLDGTATDFGVIHALMEHYVTDGFTVLSRDDDGEIIALIEEKSGDTITFDCSYNNLEYSLGRGEDLHELNNRLNHYYSLAQEFLEPQGHLLTGMGVNPYWQENDGRAVESPRYQMLMSYLGSYSNYETDFPNFFHKFSKYGGFVSASQVQLDLNMEDMFEKINMFNRLEPLKGYLFANSYFWNENWDTLISRDIFWEHSMHGIYRENVGTYTRDFTTANDFMTHIEETSMFCALRGEKYYYFYPIQVKDYLAQKEIQAYYYDKTQDTILSESIQPEEADFAYHRSYTLQDVTARGTVEFRSVCAQPLSEKMTVAAFHVGLFANFEELQQLLQEERFVWLVKGDSEALRHQFSKFTIQPDSEEKMQEFALAVLDCAKAGLKKRGKEEEEFIEPLYFRANSGLNPAKSALLELEKGQPLENILRQYAKLEK
ncbi:MAG: gamma-glutamylcysteine synthetase [Lactobacillales bacterium]|jgi:gamma-glutamylcysteine synthetase|nr:gamma-glutamylcysteine synthetase [Lactobacillales bacterium]